MRQLASIRKISELYPIEGADRIELAVVDGWKCVVGKGEFQVGDLCVYFEIDSLLPLDNPAFAFLAGRNVKMVKETIHAHDVQGGIPKGEIVLAVSSSTRAYSRLKTTKMKGQISQGLAMPLEKFGVGAILIPGDMDFDEAVEKGNVSPDMTEVLGILKYDTEEPSQGGSFNGGRRAGTFPEFLRKTDQERVQNVKLERYEGLDFEVSMKLDGSSCTVYLKEGKIGVCSRNQEVEEGDNAFWKGARKSGILGHLEGLRGAKGYIPACDDIAFQGELLGPGIQGNKEKLEDFDIYIFDIWAITGQRYMTPALRRSYCENFGLQHTPVLKTNMAVGTDKELLLSIAEGPSLNASQREGLVFKANQYDRYGELPSFKAISNKWLLKHE